MVSEGSKDSDSNLNWLTISSRNDKWRVKGFLIAIWVG
jgi:hypothetical protein